MFRLSFAKPISPIERARFNASNLIRCKYAHIHTHAVTFKMLCQDPVSCRSAFAAELHLNRRFFVILAAIRAG